DRVLDGALEGGAVAAALAAEELPLAGTHLLEALHVLVIDEGRPRAAFLRAEPAAVFAPPPGLFADHRFSRPRSQFVGQCRARNVFLAAGVRAVNDGTPRIAAGLGRLVVPRFIGAAPLSWLHQ